MCESMYSYQKHRLIFCNCSTNSAEINDNGAIPYLPIYFAFKKVLMNFDKYRVVVDVIWLAVMLQELTTLRLKLTSKYPLIIVKNRHKLEAYSTTAVSVRKDYNHRCTFCSPPPPTPHPPPRINREKRIQYL